MVRNSVHVLRVRVRGRVRIVVSEFSVWIESLPGRVSLAVPAVCRSCQGTPEHYRLQCDYGRAGKFASRQGR